ncbi:MAG: ROK family protein, partial [Bacteroidota bacterium]
AATEVWLLRNPFNSDTFAEESISARAITNAYRTLVPSAPADLHPHQVYDIATGRIEGDKISAQNAFNRFGQALGMALAEVVTLLDGLVVVGGGLANGHELFFPAMIRELNSSFKGQSGSDISRLVMKVYDLQDDHGFNAFAAGQSTTVNVPFSDRKIEYDPEKRTGVALSVLGASRAISLGAYAFAVNSIEQGRASE